MKNFEDTLAFLDNLDKYGKGEISADDIGLTKDEELDFDKKLLDVMDAVTSNKDKSKKMTKEEIAAAVDKKNAARKEESKPRYNMDIVKEIKEIKEVKQVEEFDPWTPEEPVEDTTPDEVDVPDITDSYDNVTGPGPFVTVEDGQIVPAEFNEEKESKWIPFGSDEKEDSQWVPSVTISVDKEMNLVVVDDNVAPTTANLNKSFTKRYVLLGSHEDEDYYELYKVFDNFLFLTKHPQAIFDIQSFEKYFTGVKRYDEDSYKFFYSESLGCIFAYKVDAKSYEEYTTFLEEVSAGSDMDYFVNMFAVIDSNWDDTCCFNFVDDEYINQYAGSKHNMENEFVEEFLKDADLDPDASLGTDILTSFPSIISSDNMGKVMFNVISNYIALEDDVEDEEEDDFDNTSATEMGEVTVDDPAEAEPETVEVEPVTEDVEVETVDPEAVELPEEEEAEEEAVEVEEVDPDDMSVDIEGVSDPNLIVNVVHV